MGVPKFFRWLAERYPLINISVGEGGINIPEFDCLYLDMNGIIHNCSHPKDHDYTSKISERDMMLGIFKYIDKLVQIVKPQQLLYMAIDGVAPRAKMNQQRSRRFRSARDAAAALEELKANGGKVGSDVFDSNCITPGTPFMARLDLHLRSFIAKKLKEDEVWKRFKVIYSGHATPGEGEHKIMEYIRAQRSRPTWKPNLRHCIYGLDADLIMLGLVTHEPHFALLREEIDFTSFQRNKNSTKTVQKQTKQVKWQLLSLTILREYLHRDFGGDNPPDFYDLERIVDDFVLMCMLCGNDFLPHIPTLDIGEDAITFLMDTYRRLLRTEMGGFICDSGKINWKRFEMLLAAIGDVEDKIFAEREKTRQVYLRRAAKRGYRDARDEQRGRRIQADQERAALLAKQLGGQDGFKNRYYLNKFGFDPLSSSGGGAAATKQSVAREALCFEYMHGLQWVMRYYYGGVASWGWFFPFHYAPLASDLKPSALGANVAKLDAFTLGKPFNPFQQLLGCLPPSGAKFLPKPYQSLMTSGDSPIADFYPATFEVDMNGAHNPWEGVNLLPFIDEARLNKAMEGLLEKCSEADQKRIERLPPILCVHDPGQHTSYQCSMPSAWGFGKLDERHSRFTPMTPDTHIPLKGKSECFTPALYPGTVLPAPGFPSLMHVQLGWPGNFEEIQVNLFGFASRKKTLVLTPKDKQPNGIPLDMASKVVADTYIGRNVFVGWPMLREAIVVGVVGSDGTYKGNFRTLKDGSVVAAGGSRKVSFSRHSDFAFNQYGKTMEGLRTMWLKGRDKKAGVGGVRAPKGDVLLKVRRVRTVLLNRVTGATRKAFVEKEDFVLASMVLLRHPSPDPRLVATTKSSLENRYPKRSPVLCLQPGALFGAVGTVDELDPSTKKVHVTLQKLPARPPFGYRIVQTVKDQYTSVLSLSRKLNLPYGVLLKIMSTLPVVEGKQRRRRNFGSRSDDRTDVGLNFRVYNKLVVPGIMRSQNACKRAYTTSAWKTGDTVQRVEGSAKVTHKWEVTKEGIKAVNEYIAKFPHVVRLVSSRPELREYSIEEMFGAGAEGQKRLEALLEWKKSQRFFKVPLVPVSSVTMPGKAIVACEKALDVLSKHDAESATTVTKAMRATDLIPAVVDTWQEPMQLFEGGRSRSLPALGERVANIGSTRVPFGLRGLVVAIHPRTRCVEVVFDRCFIGGTTLSSICSNGRGCLLPWKALLSLSATGAPVSTQRTNGSRASSKSSSAATGGISMEQMARQTAGAISSRTNGSRRSGIVPASVLEASADLKMTNTPKDSKKKVKKKKKKKAAEAGPSAHAVRAPQGVHASLQRFLSPSASRDGAAKTDDGLRNATQSLQASLGMTTVATKVADVQATRDLMQSLGVSDSKKSEASDNGSTSSDAIEKKPKPTVTKILKKKASPKQAVTKTPAPSVVAADGTVYYWKMATTSDEGNDDPILSSDSGDEEVTKDNGSTAKGQSTNDPKSRGETNASAVSNKADKIPRSDAARRKSSVAEDGMTFFSSTLVKYPFQSLIFVCIIAAILASGFSEMNVEEDINELWIEEGSVVSAEVDYTKANTYRIEDSESQLMMTVRHPNRGDSVLTEYALDRHLQAAKAMMDITVTRGSRTYGIADVCSSLRKYLFQCTRVTILDCFKEGAFDFPAYNAMYTISAVLEVVGATLRDTIQPQLVEGTEDNAIGLVKEDLTGTVEENMIESVEEAITDGVNLDLTMTVQDIFKLQVEDGLVAGFEQGVYNGTVAVVEGNTGGPDAALPACGLSAPVEWSVYVDCYMYLAYKDTPNTVANLAGSYISGMSSWTNFTNEAIFAGVGLDRTAASYRDTAMDQAIQGASGGAVSLATFGGSNTTAFRDYCVDTALATINPAYSTASLGGSDSTTYQNTLISIALSPTSINTTLTSGKLDGFVREVEDQTVAAVEGGTFGPTAVATAQASYPSPTFTYRDALLNFGLKYNPLIGRDVAELGGAGSENYIVTMVDYGLTSTYGTTSTGLYTLQTQAVAGTPESSVETWGRIVIDLGLLTYNLSTSAL
eukprot:g1935.t1